MPPRIHFEHTVEEAIVRQYQSGASENAVAKTIGVNRGTIRKVLLRRGAPIRGRSEAETLKWSKMSLRQRQRQVAAANAAARNRKQSFQERRKRAITNQIRRSHVSLYEIALMTMLEQRGIVVEQQTVIGKYNCDLTIGSVAVEVRGGNWDYIRTPFFRRRLRYFLNTGWHVVIVLVSRTYPMSAEIADHVATLIQEFRRAPTTVRQYRVIWGTCERTTGGSADDRELALIMPFKYATGTSWQNQTITR